MNFSWGRWLMQMQCYKCIFPSWEQMWMQPRKTRQVLKAAAMVLFDVVFNNGDTREDLTTVLSLTHFQRHELLAFLVKKKNPFWLFLTGESNWHTQAYSSLCWSDRPVWQVKGLSNSLLSLFAACLFFCKQILSILSQAFLSNKPSGMSRSFLNVQEKRAELQDASSPKGFCQLCGNSSGMSSSSTVLKPIWILMIESEGTREMATLWLRNLSWSRDILCSDVPTF